MDHNSDITETGENGLSDEDRRTLIADFEATGFAVFRMGVGADWHWAGALVAALIPIAFTFLLGFLGLIISIVMRSASSLAQYLGLCPTFEATEKRVDGIAPRWSKE